MPTWYRGRKRFKTVASSNSCRCCNCTSPRIVFSSALNGSPSYPRLAHPGGAADVENARRAPVPCSSVQNADWQKGMYARPARNYAAVSCPDRAAVRGPQRLWATLRRNPAPPSFDSLLRVSARLRTLIWHFEKKDTLCLTANDFLSTSNQDSAPT